MKLLITPAEVLLLAFPTSEQFREEVIRPSLIEVAQLQYLRPVLGGLYEHLEESRYDDFVANHLKTALAYYVRSQVIGEMAASVGTIGILQSSNTCGEGASIRQQQRLRQEALSIANQLMEEAVRLIESEPDEFPDYTPQQNIRHKITLKGGLLL